MVRVESLCSLNVACRLRIIVSEKVGFSYDEPNSWKRRPGLDRHTPKGVWVFALENASSRHRRSCCLTPLPSTGSKLAFEMDVAEASALFMMIGNSRHER